MIKNPRTVGELGKNYKEKHPECDMSDVEAGRMLKEKYPNDYWDIVDVEEVGKALVQLFAPKEQGLISNDPFSSNLPNLPQINYRQHQKDLERTVQELNTYYNPRQGRLSAWWNRGKAESRTKLLHVLKAEQIAVLEQGALLEEHALKSERNRIEFRKFIATHAVELLALKSQANLLEIGIREGLDGQSVVDINRTKALTEIEIERERELSKIKLEDYQGRKQVDNAAKAEEYRIDQENISRIQQERLELIDRATNRLFSLYDQKTTLEASDDPAKNYKLAQLNFNIKIAEEALRAEQNRFVQDTTGETARGAETDPHSSGSDRETDSPVN